jgi:archaellum biogenesis ATPase FlaH
MSIHSDLESFISGGNLIISTSINKYEKILIDILKFLINKKKLDGILVTVNKPCDIILSTLEKNKVDTKKLVIVDCVSSTVDKKEDNKIFLKRPFNPTDVSIELGRLTKKEEYKFIIFDTLTTILTYDGMTIIRFLQHTVSDFLTKRKLTIILAIDPDFNDIKMKLVSQFCNKIISI